MWNNKYQKYCKISASTATCYENIHDFYWWQSYRYCLSLTFIIKAIAKILLECSESKDVISFQLSSHRPWNCPQIFWSNSPRSKEFWRLSRECLPSATHSAGCWKARYIEELVMVPILTDVQPEGTSNWLVW